MSDKPTEVQSFEIKRLTGDFIRTVIIEGNLRPKQAEVFTRYLADYIEAYSRLAVRVVAGRP